MPRCIWVVSSVPSISSVATLTEWEFSEQLAEMETKSPCIIHLLKEAVRTFGLPQNDANAQLCFKGEVVPNRKPISSFEGDPLEFELIYNRSSPVKLEPTKFLSPLDFVCSEPHYNDEATTSEIIYLEDDHLLVNNMVFDELRHDASVSEYIPVIGALGNTGTGKSLVMASLLGKQRHLPRVRRVDQNESTTANCNLFYTQDRSEIYLDFEGECGTDPTTSLNRNGLQKIVDNIRKNESIYRRDKKQKKSKRSDVDRKNASKRRSEEIPKELLKEKKECIVEEPKKLTRRQVVAKLLPKLAYIICDAILFVTTDEIHADYSVYDRCVAFAMRANAFVQDTDRPALVVVHNKYNVSLNNLQKEMDVDASTKQFLETFDPELKLAGYFSAVFVVRLPLIGDAYDNPMLRTLWDQQIDQLRSVLNTCKNNRSQHRITMSCQLTNKLWYRYIKVIVDDMIFDKPISAAQHVQTIIQMEFEEHITPLITLFHKIYDRKPRTIDWFYQCARLALDTLGRLWGISLREGGYAMEANRPYGKKILSQLLTALDKMKPCTAQDPTKQFHCKQTKALHVCHRSNINDHIRSRYQKIRAYISNRGLTMTWEGEFTFIVNEEERDEQLTHSFWKTAECFATNDIEGIQEAMQLVMEHEDYRSCIWETLLLSNAPARVWTDSDQELRSWAKRLVVDSMKLLDLPNFDNIWEKAVSDWAYLNVLCKEIPHSAIHIGQKIGSGTFGEVFDSILVQHKESIHCAVKVIRSDAKGFDLNVLRREIAVMSLIEEKSLLRLYGYCQFEEPISSVTHYYLVLELMDLNLSHWLDANASCTDVDCILQIASSIAEGIQTLHNHNIIHRDIKPANILLRRNQSDRNYRVVVADMGLARLAIHEPMTYGIGTCGYIAPEIIQKKCGEDSYTHTVDVYSFGKILQDLVSVIPENDDPILSEHRGQLLNLASLCCQEDPSRRTSIIHAMYRLKELTGDPQILNESEEFKEEIPEIGSPTTRKKKRSKRPKSKRNRSKSKLLENFTHGLHGSASSL